MRSPQPLPDGLGRRFTVRQARDAGVSPGRLRSSDLATPFHGVRSKPIRSKTEKMDAFERQAAEHRIQARRYSPRLKPGQFFSHATAAAILGGPLPLTFAEEAGEPLDGALLPLHVSTLGDGPLVRTRGVHGHRADPRVAKVLDAGDFRVADAATAWAQLGGLALPDLVALGDFFCRVWRSGPGRRDAGRTPLATPDDLRAQLRFGRRPGIHRLRRAVDLIREDSWSPRESKLRCLIVSASLPEPVLNHDVYDDHGRFLGCVDLAYPHLKIAIEYHGAIHSDRYARDVERIAALRAAGWTVIEVTSELFHRPDELLRRIQHALAV
ncbi:DUF559 domain-containing protein [Microbacterium tumbae]